MFLFSTTYFLHYVLNCLSKFNWKIRFFNFFNNANSIIMN